MIEIVESFLVLGIEARTTNNRETSGQGAIGPLWGRLTKDALLERIPNRVDDRIIAVYSDYENDRDGEYSYLLGAKVKRGQRHSGRDVLTPGWSGRVRRFYRQGRVGGGDGCRHLERDLVA